jgi:hypothetical protein
MLMSADKIIEKEFLGSLQGRRVYPFFMKDNQCIQICLHDYIFVHKCLQMSVQVYKSVRINVYRYVYKFVHKITFRFSFLNIYYFL